ncbi:selenium-dependent molybdenum cofactor biosynthesis protein YqeB [Chloroflexota bacterium]
MKLDELVILIKGAGEVASGVAHRLFRARFKLCLTETYHPLAVSRGVTFSEAVYDGGKEIEGVTAKLIKSATEVNQVWAENKLPLIIDPEAKIKDTLKPHVIVDAIMTKKSPKTKITDAPLVIGVGPGFRVGRDAHFIVESNHSENLGQVIFAGEAEKDTGIPVSIGGLTSERVIHSPKSGLFLTNKEIGDIVNAGETIASVDGQAIQAPIGGVVRALLRSETEVDRGVKLAEMDQVNNTDICFSIRDKMSAIGGGVLEAILMRFNI